MSETKKPTDLFEYAAFARRGDPSTSHAAARSIDGELPRLEALVFQSVKDAGRAGRTLDEAIDDLGIDKVTVSPRFRPLCDKGLIKTAGTRPGKAGRQQTIWIAA